jgi:UDP-N-acetylmuramoylalanine--D-glutamate ligase
VLVPSPGIPPHAPAMKAALAAGVLLVSEVELAASVSVAPVVAITGTDGKSTTTEMIGAVVRAAGRPVEVAGNIGTPLSERARAVGADGVLVAEISEFQLWSCGLFKPRVAVITNVAEDHTDYFGGDMGAVADSMARVLRDLGPGDTAVLRADDPVVWGFAVPEGVRRVGFGPHPRAEGFGLEAGVITCDGVPILQASEMSLSGPHNVANAQAALAAGRALGLPLAPMCQALRTFVGLPHRLEKVRVRGGVTFVDDSKATNPHAALVGLKALPGRLVVITGGYDKGLDLRGFCNVLAERARAVVAVGPTAARTLSTLGARVLAESAVDLAAALERAVALAEPGDTVVLSPAASSFDAWRSYAHRGAAFAEAVKALPEVD